MATFTGSAAGDSIRPGNISGTVAISGAAPFDLSVNDFLNGLGGNDTLDGGLGNDQVDGGDGLDTVNGGAGDDTLNAGSVFSALDGADSLNGGDGNDTVQQIGFGDRAFGGAGDDILNVDAAGAVTLDGGSGIDTLIADGLDISASVIAGIENLAGNAILTGAQLALFTRVGTSTPGFGTSYTYTFTNTATIADFTGRIAEANDRYFLRGVDGLLNNDRITFDANATNDADIQGFEGDDILRGGRGDDNLEGDEGADSLVGGGGSDVLNAGFASSLTDGVDTLDGGAGSDLLQQIGQGDIARGGSGNDVLNVDEAGPATLDGGAGLDILVADGLDISASTITGIETLWNNAILKGSQLTAFNTVGASTPASFTNYTYTITDASTADFRGAVLDELDVYFIRGVDGIATNNKIRFDDVTLARASLQGYEGNDSLRGGGGNDTLEGDEGADTLIGGGGSDQLFAGSVFSVDDGIDSLDGGAGDDILAQLGQGDIAKGGAGNDTFDLDEGGGGGSFEGSTGTDILVADGLDITGKTITGVEWLWNNAILTGAQLSGFTLVGVGSFGSATNYSYQIIGGATADFTGKIAEANDTYFLTGVDNVATGDRILFDAASTARVSIRGFEGDDSLRGGASNDTLQGEEGADTLIGGGGADQISAGSVSSALDGADSVNGGAGADYVTEIGFADSVDAGSGNDYVDIDELGVVLLTGGTGTDTLQADGLDISGMAVTGFEALWNNAILTAAQAQQFTIFGASTPGFQTTYTYGFTTATDVIDLTGKTADDFDPYILNGSATLANNDTILFGVDASNNVTINGFAGNDSLRAGEGDDVLNGGEGDDTLDGGLGLNTLDGGNGVDAASFASSTVGVTANLATVGAQQISASAFSNLIGFETAIGSAFDDLLTGTTGANTLDGGDGADTLSGDSGADRLLGGGGNDSLLGGGSADALFGGAGADTLNGGSGNDQLTGEAGADRFLFNPGGGTDTVLDYVDGTDRIAVSGFGAAFDTAAEVRAAATQQVGGVQIALGTTTVLISGLALASFTAADIDVV
jgi:Ca2+-binding RTX toxin-like protein